MSLRDIQLKQKQNIEVEINKLLDLLRETEQRRDVATIPTERAKYELEIETLKSSIEKYKDELQSLENEIKKEAKRSKTSRTGLENYRVRLDDSLTDKQLNTDFATEVLALLDLMEYDIAKEAISGVVTATPPIFVATQDGDFEPLRTLFQCVYGIVDESAVVSFYNIYELNRKRLGLNLGVIITNTYIAPSARFLASQYQVQILTFEDLLNIVFKVTRYLKARCRDYEQNNKLYHTFVEVKYLRRGRGKFKDNQATRQEFLVTEASDGSNFEAKGELTPYVDSWLLRDENSQICILGEYGTGKTSFATQYFYRRAVAYLENPLKNRIPLLVSLNRYHKSADVEQMMTDFLVNECGIRRNFDTFLKLAARGKLLIILDGFDEMAKQVDVNIRRHNFKEISRLLVGNNKVILLGRPNYFLTQAEINDIFSQETESADPYRVALKKSTLDSIPRYEILTLALFDRWQIEEFLKKQSEYLKSKGIDDWRELQRTIYETYNLEELARTPVLLEVITKTISEIRGKVAHINAAKLYQIYTGFWLDREYDEKGDVRWLITRNDKELFVLDLAWTMLITDDLNPEIHFSQLSEQVRNYFGLEMASEIEYFSSDIRFCSYLTHSESDGNYRFIHKSFMEYFSARRICKALFGEQDVSAVVTERPITDEVFFFLCQMVGPDEIDLLRKLSKEEKGKTNEKFIIDLTARILKQSMSICEHRGAIQPAEEWADRLLQYSDEFDFLKGKLWGSIAKGNLKAQLGQYEEAETLYRVALNISEQMGDRLSLSRSLVQLGTICQSRSEWDGALEYYQQALAIFEAIGDRASAGQTLAYVGTNYRSRGDLARALEYYQRALAIFEEIGDKASVGQTLTNVSEIYQTRGDIDRSLQYSQQSLAIFREISDRRSERLALSQLGYIYQLTGRYEEADRIYHEALSIAQEIGDRQGVSRALSQLGYICTAIARYVEAEAYYREALNISDELGDRQGVGSALSNIGHIYQEMARYEDAVSLYQESITVLESIGDTHAVGVSLYNLANVYSVQGKFSGSSELYQKALEIFERIGDRSSVGMVVHQLGMMSQKTGDFEQAESLYRRSLETNQQIGNVRGVQNLLESLGNLAKAQQNFDEAERFYMDSLDKSLKIGDRRRECEISVKLGRLARRTGDKQRAIEYYARYIKLAREMNLSLLADVVQEYDQLRAKVLINPFIVGSPIYDEFFCGRNRELSELHNHIQKQINVMLIGGCRMGKTSLLMQLDRQLELPFVSIFVDLQAFPGQAEGLLNGVIRRIVEALLKQGLLSSERWEKYSLTYAHDFVKALESVIDEAKEKLKDIKLVLMLDEGERLFESGSQLGGVLRAALTVNRDIVAIIAGTPQLLKMPEDAFVSPLFNIFTILPLKPFSREDTEFLITEPSKQAGVTYELDALEQIYELSGGIPLYVQAIGSQLIELANQESKDRIGVEDVNKVIPEIFEMISVTFQYSLYQLEDKERAILTTVASGNSLKDIRKQDIRSLEIGQIIVEDKGSYRFVSRLFEEWFKQHAISS